MDGNNKFLSILFKSIGNKEDEYINIKEFPKNNFKGKYLLVMDYHESQKFPKNSTTILLNQDSSFIVRNYPYSKSFFASDTLKFISIAEGKWKFVKHREDNKDFPVSLVLNFTQTNGEYNSVPNTEVINNFTFTKEIYMDLKDSAFSFVFYHGDPDHGQNRFYFRQI